MNVDEITDELAELIQDAGLTEGRLVRFGRKIMDALGESDPAAAMEILVRLAEQMGDDKYHRALRNALGIGANEKSSLLSERRQDLLESDDFPSVAVDTLRRWEKASFEYFAGLIIEHGKGRLVADLTEVRDGVALLERLVKGYENANRILQGIVEEQQRLIATQSAHIESQRAVIDSMLEDAEALRRRLEAAMPSNESQRAQD